METSRALERTSGGDHNARRPCSWREAQGGLQVARALFDFKKSYLSAASPLASQWKNSAEESPLALDSMCRHLFGDLSMMDWRCRPTHRPLATVAHLAASAAPTPLRARAREHARMRAHDSHSRVHTHITFTIAISITIAISLSYHHHHYHSSSPLPSCQTASQT